MSSALITPEIISWARQRAGLSTSVLAKKLRVEESKLNSWESGESAPTFNQAQKIANHTRIPFGYLFLERPPIEELPLPDLRTVGDQAPAEISVDLRDTIRDVLERQLWYQEYVKENGSPPVKWVGHLKGNRDPNIIVASIKEALGIPAKPKRGNWEDYLSELVKKIEDSGILVMRNSMVGNNSQRILNVREFRGFALADELAPVIFVNTADCPEARLFTLIHELAHIWIGESGISDASPESQVNVEKLCNQVSAELLAPTDEFRELWDIEAEQWTDNIPPLCEHFHVSRWVIARRALELGLIPKNEFWAYINKIQDDYRNRERSGNGPSYNKLQPMRVSKTLTRAVVTEALSGRMLLRDAWKLIGIRPERIADFAKTELKI